MKRIYSSNRSSTMSTPVTAPVDRLSSLMERFCVHAHLFHAGPLCGITHFSAEPGHAFLHVLRRGEMQVTHKPKSGPPRRIQLSEPTLLFYARPLAHDFHNAPQEGSDMVCATLNFDGGEHHPLARALPPLVILPLHAIDGLQHTLALLFSETDQRRCGQRVLADRLFEVLLLQLLRWLLDHPQESGMPPGLLAGLSHPGLARVLVAMHEAPAEAWSLQRMADCAGLSRSSFATTFKAHVGTTPADYLTRWRIALAQNQLRQGDSIKTIADELGYANASSLSRVFTQVVGVSPREWVKEGR
jgi:AraC-like DNA-binding protein